MDLSLKTRVDIKKCIILKQIFEPDFSRLTDMGILKVLSKFIFRDYNIISALTTATDITIVTIRVKIAAIIAIIFRPYPY